MQFIQLENRNLRHFITAILGFMHSLQFTNSLPIELPSVAIWQCSSMLKLVSPLLYIGLTFTHTVHGWIFYLKTSQKYMMLHRTVQQSVKCRWIFYKSDCRRNMLRGPPHVNHKSHMVWLSLRHRMATLMAVYDCRLTFRTVYAICDLGFSKDICKTRQNTFYLFFKAVIKIFLAFVKASFKDLPEHISMTSQSIFLYV